MEKSVKQQIKLQVIYYFKDVIRPKVEMDKLDYQEVFAMWFDGAYNRFMKEGIKSTKAFTKKEVKMLDKFDDLMEVAYAQWEEKDEITEGIIEKLNKQSAKILREVGL